MTDNELYEYIIKNKESVLFAYKNFRRESVELDNAVNELYEEVVKAVRQSYYWILLKIKRLER